jgi:hypothetical protein
MQFDHRRVASPNIEGRALVNGAPRFADDLVTGL